MKNAPKAPLTIEDFIDRILIVCPRCSEMATVTSTSPRRRARLVCTHCGLAKSRETTSYTIGEVTDPYFHLPLWLQTSCSSHTVWAYNPDHLAFLKQYVEATDRRRPMTTKGSGFNKSLAGRLPRWMQLARNREQVSKAIAAMESKLDAANAKLEQTK